MLLTFFFYYNECCIGHWDMFGINSFLRKGICPKGEDSRVKDGDLQVTINESLTSLINFHRVKVEEPLFYEN